MPDGGVSAVVRLWRQQPSVLRLGAVYPGAILADARFLADGQVALVVGLPVTAGGVNQTTAMHEVWLLDPSTGRLARVTLASIDLRAAVVALAPDGQQVAYVTAGSSPSGSTSLSPGGGPAPAPSRQDARHDTVWIAPLDGSRAPRPMLEMDTPVNQGFGTDAEQIVDLIWIPDSTRLVIISRQGGIPTRTRLWLMNVGREDESGLEAQVEQLVVLPAGIAPGAAVPDPSGQWLALMAHATTAGGGDVQTLCTVELRPGGTFRELADLGSAQRAPTTPAIAWASDRQSGSAGRLAFAAPVPAAAASGAGWFDLFAAFRAAAPPSGLFLADLQALGLEASQPRRLGAMTNVLGLVWRSENALFGFARQDDGALALRSIDAATAVARDVGVRLPAAVGQGNGLSARWDADNGRVLLLSRPSSSTTVSGTGLASPLEAWLVSFTAAPHAAR